MPTARKLLAGLALAITAISCSEDKSPTAPAAPDNQAPTAAVAGRAALLTNVPVTGVIINQGNAAFAGTMTVTAMKKDPANPHGLLVSGRMVLPDGSQDTFTDAPATLVAQGGPTQPNCSILVLDIGAIHLDLLGLVVDLAPVHLDVHATSGAGNLLGNLLCAVANLLNGVNVNAVLGALTNLLNQITAILGGL